MSVHSEGLVSTLTKEHTLSRLRELRPLPGPLVPVLHAIGSPLAWIALFVIAALVFTYRLDAFASKLGWFILAVGLAGLYGGARVISRDLAEDLRPLPPECETDRELQLAIERLQRGGGVIRVGQGNVIAEYVRAHYH